MKTTRFPSKTALAVAIGALCALPVTAQGVAVQFGLAPGALVFADGETVEELQRQLIDISESMRGLEATARREQRELTADEQSQIETAFQEFEAIEARIEVARSREQNVTRAQLAERGGSRPTRAAEPNGVTRAAHHSTRAQTAAADRTARPSLPAQPRGAEHGMGGFRDSVEFLQVVMSASARGGHVDPRLIANAPSEYGSEGVGADGGFAVPPDFRAEIIRKVMGEESLLARTDQQTSSTNSMTFPIDSTTPSQSTGGVQAYWESEAGQKTQSKPKLDGATVKMHKVIALVPLTDELLEDAPAMTSYVTTKAPEKIDYKVNEAIIRGTGVGQPLGILNSPGTIIIPAESGQIADTVVFDNVANIWGRATNSAKRSGVWLANSDIETQLMKMSFPGSGTAVPVYLPPGGLSAAPYGTLLGRPIITSDAMPALGDEGDLVLADMKAYLTLTKRVSLRQDVSIHLFFDYDITAFRFVMRIGGQPWFDSPIARPGNQSSRGFFVALGARA